MACDVPEFTRMSEHQRRALVRMVRDEVARSGRYDQSHAICQTLASHGQNYHSPRSPRQTQRA